MADDSGPVRLYGCRWAWCRLNFSDNDALGNHVVFEHIRRAIPVRRRDIPMLRRTEEGLGDSLKISDIMRDSSSSLSRRSELLKDPHQLPPSSSLPSPPASSPVLPLQEENISDDIEQQPNFAGPHPTFASLSSPAGSLASLKIPTSPSFSTLVRRSNKRKEASDTQQERLGKRSKQYSLSQESASAASTGSHLSVEEHLTQTSGQDNDDEGDSDKNTDADAQGEEDIGSSQADRSREDVVMIPPTSGTPSSLESSQQEAYQGELNWDGSHVLSPQFQSSLSDSQERSANPFLKTMSQPPSQLQLLSPLYHTHRTNSSPSQLQTTGTDTNSSVFSLPLNPVALSSPTGFTASTPQRQTWYQSALRRRVSSRSPSGETTPKPSRTHEPTGTLPTVSEEQSPSQQSPSKVQVHVPSTPQPVRESPLTKKSAFRSGTLRVTHPSVSPLHSHPQSPSRPQPMASNTNADEGTTRSVAALIRDDFVIPEEEFGFGDTQSQLDQQSPMTQDISSYPPLQTQAPYQSQSLSQLD